MCLAIAMYLVTGTLSLLCQVLLALSIFLLNLLGKAILLVCASVYTVAPPKTPPTTSQPFVTMYPEVPDFEQDYQAMARVSLETVTSGDNGPTTTTATTTTTKRVSGVRRNSR